LIYPGIRVGLEAVTPTVVGFASSAAGGHAAAPQHSATSILGAILTAGQSFVIPNGFWSQWGARNRWAPVAYPQLQTSAIGSCSYSVVHSSDSVFASSATGTSAVTASGVMQTQFAVAARSHVAGYNFNGQIEIPVGASVGLKPGLYRSCAVGASSWNNFSISALTTTSWSNKVALNASVGNMSASINFQGNVDSNTGFVFVTRQTATNPGYIE
jgi:hypothetical protein